MIRVVAFSDFAPPETNGGVERTLGEIYGRLARRGQAQVEVVALAEPSLPRLDERDGVTIRRAPRLPMERWTGLQVAVSPAAWRLGFATVRTTRPDVVHAHTLFFHSSLVAAAAAWRYRVPLLLTVHVGSMAALPQPQRAAVHLYERTVGRALLASAQRVIGVSQDVAAHVERLGARREQVVVIPNGVDVDRFHPSARYRARERRPVIVCVGRLIMNKGQHLLIEAARRLRSEGVEFELWIVGDGPRRQQLEAEVRRRHLDDTVSFLGEQPHIEELLHDADVFVRPSLTEGMSLAVLESMAAGLPTVVTDVSGSRELIEHGTHGLIVPPGDVAELTAALRAVLLDAPLRQRLGAAARWRAERYSWDRVADATMKEFERVAR